MICCIIQLATHNNTKTKKELKHSGKRHHQNLCKINQHEFNDDGQYIKRHRPLLYKKPNKKASAFAEAFCVGDTGFEPVTPCL